MFNIKLSGTVTSKRAMHLPVIRHWRLVWERVEFGTKVDRFDLDLPLNFDFEGGPDEGVTIDLAGGLSVKVSKMDRNNFASNPSFAFAVLLNGYPIPAMYATIPIPAIGPKESPTKLLLWDATVWKGVQVNLTGLLSLEP